MPELHRNHFSFTASKPNNWSYQRNNRNVEAVWVFLWEIPELIRIRIVNEFIRNKIDSRN